MDDDGILFYNLIDQNAVGCWNSRLPFSKDTQGVLDRDDIGLVFPSDVKVLPLDGEAWVEEQCNRMPVGAARAARTRPDGCGLSARASQP